MGLFGKKVEICVAFVGRCSRGVDLRNEEQMSLLYAPQVRRFAEETCPGLPLRAWYWSDWSGRVYAESVLRDVRDNGFGAYDTGDKKKLFDELMEPLVLRYGVGVGGLDFHPACLIDRGVFVLLCKVRVKEAKLGD